MQVLPPITTPQGSVTNQRTQPLGTEKCSYATNGDRTLYTDNTESSDISGNYRSFLLQIETKSQTKKQHLNCSRLQTRTLPPFRPARITHISCLATLYPSNRRSASLFSHKAHRLPNTSTLVLQTDQKYV